MVELYWNICMWFFQSELCILTILKWARNQRDSIEIRITLMKLYFEKQLFFWYPSLLQTRRLQAVLHTYILQLSAIFRFGKRASTVIISWQNSNVFAVVECFQNWRFWAGGKEKQDKYARHRVSLAVEERPLLHIGAEVLNVCTSDKNKGGSGQNNNGAPGKNK